MEFICYREWYQLPEDADAMFEANEQNSLFLSRKWFENLTTHALSEDQSLLLACVLEDGHVLAILPMLQCVQGGLSALSGCFTTLYSFLLVESYQQNEVLNCLAEGLSNLPVHPIRFEPVDAADQNMICLRESLESCNFKSEAYLRFYNWSHVVNGQSFEQYMEARPSHLCNTIRRKQRKLEREHGYDIQLFKVDDIEQALSDYSIVYMASWKANEFFSEFTPSLVRSLSQLGWLRLAILYAKQQPVAAQIWFVVHGKANIYRLVYDDHWKVYSPGSILTQYMMRYVIDIDKVTEIDFLTGNEYYKQDWMTVRKERLGYVFAKESKLDNKIKQTIYFFKNKLFKNRNKQNL